MEKFNLYQDLILDYARSTRGRGRVEAPTGSGTGRVASCGDRSHVTVRVVGGVVTEAKVDCDGCAISLASAAMLVETIEGRSLSEAKIAVRRALAVFRGEAEFSSEEAYAPLGGIYKHPSRLKCASLSWHAMLVALEESETEEGETPGR